MGITDTILKGAPTKDLAVDLGTSYTVIYTRGVGIVLNEPSCIAINKKRNQVIAVGDDAKNMLGRTPLNLEVIFPIVDGVISDFESCELMIKHFIEKVHQQKIAKPRVVICVPSGITGVEQRAVQEAAEFAGARKPVYVIEDSMAAAIGCGLPIHEPNGSMIVDFGGGTIEVAVISLGGVVASQTSRIGSSKLDTDIKDYIQDKFGLYIGIKTAEEIKIALGSAVDLEEEHEAEIVGVDVDSGLPKKVTISTTDVRKAMKSSLKEIMSVVSEALDQTPPELSADIMGQGIVLTGAASQLNGFSELLGEITGMNIVTTNNPNFSVVNGAGKCLEEFEVLKTVLLQNVNS